MIARALLLATPAGLLATPAGLLATPAGPSAEPPTGPPALPGNQRIVIMARGLTYRPGTSKALFPVASCSAFVIEGVGVQWQWILIYFYHTIILMKSQKVDLLYFLRARYTPSE
jgi:hypothetical protein